MLADKSIGTPSKELHSLSRDHHVPSQTSTSGDFPERPPKRQRVDGDRSSENIFVTALIRDLDLVGDQINALPYNS
jgi:hypothetical protein